MKNHKEDVMATIKDTAATSALNEEKYINKLYGTSSDAQKDLLKQNYTDNLGALDTQQQSVRQQTQENINRTNVEAGQMSQAYKSRPVSYGASRQAWLSQWNQRQADTGALLGKQNDAEMELQRQRELLGQQYAAEIKRAQAANDMERAQALYDAAKAEDAQLLELRKQGATLMAKKGDKSLMAALANGELPQRDTQGETWAEVLRNEADVNSIYDSKLEAQNQQAQIDYLAKLSELAAQQRQQQQSTDKSLTESYVDALRKARNYQEVQGAYGQGSGTAAQAALTRDAELQKQLTSLRGAQMDADAKAGMTGVGYGTALRGAIAKNQEAVNAERNKALLDAAEKEEQTLVDLQKFTGDYYAKKGDYSILGKLYGLTDKQISKLKKKKSQGQEEQTWNGKKQAGKKEYTLTPQDLIWIRNS